MTRIGDIGSARIRCAPSLTRSAKHLIGVTSSGAALFALALKTSNNMIAPCCLREDPPPLKPALVDLPDL